MANDHAYPAHLAEFTRVRWPADAAPLPEPFVLEELISTAYQASLLRDEERPVSFRLVLCDPADLPADHGPPKGLHRLVFDRPRPFAKHELRRLSPAATYHRSLIGVRIAKDTDGRRLEIWASFIRVRDGCRMHKAVERHRTRCRACSFCAWRHRGGSRSRAVSTRSRSSEAVASPITRSTSSNRSGCALGLRPVRAELDRLHAEAQEKAGTRWATLDPTFTRRLAQQMVKRIIAVIRTAHHGGTLLFLPPDVELREIAAHLHVKYTFLDDAARNRYRTIILKAMERVATAASETGCVTWEMFEASKSLELVAFDEAISELAHLVAALANADGAVVLTKRFDLVGFGAEIVGDLPEIACVERARDLEGDNRTTESVEGVGTRHRSAYRFCQRFHDAIAIVVSQDGTVRFVAHKDGNLTYWDHVSPGSADV